MKIDYNVTGSERKALVGAIATFTGKQAKYMSVPGLEYVIGPYTVDKHGALSWTDEVSDSQAEQLVEHLSARGFEPYVETTENESFIAGINSLAVSMPSDSLDQRARANLDAILKAKGNLIRKALNATDLPVLYGNGEISFPWLKECSTTEECHAFMQLVLKLCDYARNHQRVTATEKDNDNEKYAFRCFLLRLGFIGDEFKTDRKILLRNFTGSSAFKSGHKRETAEGLATIPTEENTVKVDVSEALNRLQDPEVQEEIRAIFNGEENE